MIIKNINEIQNFNIICTNNDEVMKCKEILEKLGLRTMFNGRKDRIIVRKVYIDSNFFSNCDVVYIGLDNISFYDFIQQTKNLIPVVPSVPDIEYNEEDGRVIKINDWNSDKEVYLVNDFFGYRIKNCEKAIIKNNIDLGLLFISAETRDKARNKLIIENKLRNIASRLNGENKINFNLVFKEKYYINYSFFDNKLYLKECCWSKSIGNIYCLSEKFLEEAIKELSENELIKYFK